MFKMILIVLTIYYTVLYYIFVCVIRVVMVCLGGRAPEGLKDAQVSQAK